MAGVREVRQWGPHFGVFVKNHDWVKVPNKGRWFLGYFEWWEMSDEVMSEGWWYLSDEWGVIDFLDPNCPLNLQPYFVLKKKCLMRMLDEKFRSEFPWKKKEWIFNKNSNLVLFFINVKEKKIMKM